MNEALAEIQSLTADQRRAEIIDILVDAFRELMYADPSAFRHKFRKMAANPFAFYRGSAALFYSDMAREPDLSEDRANRVWIQGDLHAENFGTYMNSEGRLVFDVNDFDEAYLGHFDWDLRRLAASLALIGYAKAFSNEDIAAIVTSCALGYADRIHDFASGSGTTDFALTLQTTEGLVHQALERARTATRADLLDRLTVIEGCERTFRRDGRNRDIDTAERATVESAFQQYLTTLPDIAGRDPETLRIKDLVASGGFGIGSAGLPAYTILLEGTTDALETDVLISLKQANICAPSRVVEDEHIHAYFDHHGHRTVLSQRALQAHADPWLGYAEIGGMGQVVKELSPYEADLEWDEADDAGEVAVVARQLGEAVAKIHSVADEHADDTLVSFASEEAIDSRVGSDHDRFAAELTGFALAYADIARDDHRLFVDAFRNHEISGL